MCALLVYSPRRSNRLIYILKTLLTEALGIEFTLTTALSEFEHADQPRLNYSETALSDCINIRPHTILFDHGVRDYHLKVQSHEIFHKIFFQNGQGEVPFDLPGAAFWLLSRYEEYLPFKPDQHNRFQASSSLAYQYDFLQVPLINLWLETFRGILQRRYPGLQTRRRSYNFISTIDIDNVYKYKHKGFVRTIAGLVSDRYVSRMKERLRIILNRAEDPFDCYAFLIDTHRKFNIRSVFFFLLGDYGPNDKNHSASDLRFQALIKHLADYSQVGIHPSFGSNNNLRQLKIEFTRLGNITHRLITRTRQHFSMLRFPDTYHDLIQAGLTSDFSMGYNSNNGFRASYCHPYKWYDLDIESVTNLNIHPYCLTDHTLIAEARRSGNEVSSVYLPLISEVKSYGGEMITLFHNESFDEGTRMLYTGLMKACMDSDVTAPPAAHS